MTDERLPRILDAASRLFILTGFQQTQINHIAKAAKISVGSVYTLFSSKQAIFSFALKCTIDPTFIDRQFELPITERLFINLEAEVAETFETISSQLSEHLNDRTYLFHDALSDAFDIISRYAAGCLMLEKNPDEHREMTRKYIRYREVFHHTLLSYVQRYMEEGQVRRLEQPALSVKFMVESLAWWGMHVRYDVFERPAGITQVLAKETCLDALTHAFMRN